MNIKYNKALPLYEEILELRTKVLGEEHPDTLGSMNNLASLYIETKQYDELSSICKEGLSILSKLSDGDTDLLRLKFCWKLAKYGNKNESVSYARESISLMETLSLVDEWNVIFKDMQAIIKV